MFPDSTSTLHGFDRGCKFLVFLSLRENFKTLHQRNAGIDHDRKLPGENRNVFGSGIAAKFEVKLAACLLLLSIQEKNLFAPKGQRKRLLLSATRSPETCSPFRFVPLNEKLGIGFLLTNGRL